MRVSEEKLSNRKKQRKNKKRRKMIFATFFALFSILVAGTVFILSRISKTEDAIHKKVETVQLREKEVTDMDSISVLLLGIDNGAYGRDTEVGRADTMLLVTINPKQKKTTMVSIPRDSYTEIIGYGTFDKLNHAYAFGKEQFSINSVQNMLNVPIDYYVTVDMNGLIGLVDAVGGLQITPNLTFTYEEEYFEEGVIRHVDGEAALRYSRMRYDDPEGDIGRQKRQQYIIQKLVEKLLSLNSITKYEEILQTLENSVKTNFTVEKLFQVAQTHKEALQHFDSHTISGNGAMINGVYYFVIPEQEKLRISNVLRKSLDLETIDVLKHIETKEVQSSVNIEQNTPQRNTDVEEQGETYVEPNVTPIRPNEKETTVSPTKQNPTTINTTEAPVTELPNVTAVPELPKTQVPTTQEIPTTREVVAPAQPSTDPKP
ncbi:LCP family protein [uncultured Granulicatella sp.]|uniref:LCP family glycopolymer transferase n=1 Tax=uncultured Granulicatella sp. TaxID=316089 RepID=UPI00263905D0|nr:LCP family protein [uncultured Granulicatella sp.]